MLCIDADEHVSGILAASIMKAMKTPTFSTTSLPVVTASWATISGTAKVTRTGVCDSSAATRQGGLTTRCRRKVLTNVAVGRLTGDLLHDSAESLDAYLSKQNRYTTIAAREALESGKRANLVNCCCRLWSVSSISTFCAEAFSTAFPDWSISSSDAEQLHQVCENARSSEPRQDPDSENISHRRSWIQSACMSASACLNGVTKSLAWTI